VYEEPARENTIGTGKFMIATQEIPGYSLDMGESSVSIIPMRREHVNATVSVHLVSFPDFFLTFLGPRFLRILYSEIIETPDHLAFVAQDEAGSLVGFVVGIARQRLSGVHLLLLQQQWAPSFAVQESFPGCFVLWDMLAPAGQPSPRLS
jgi:hypothetical protein